VGRVVRRRRLGGQHAVELDDAGFRGVETRELEHAAQRLHAVLGLVVDDPVRALVAVLENRLEQGHLAREVVQQAGFAHLDARRDLTERAAAVAALGEHLERGVEDPLPDLPALAIGAARLTGAPARSRRHRCRQAHITGSLCRFGAADRFRTGGRF
jgi:hypothetical protein